jgi:hypothetical protein
VCIEAWEDSGDVGVPIRSGGTRCYEEGREKYARDKYVRVWRFGALFVVYLCVTQVHHNVDEL